MSEKYYEVINHLREAAWLLDSLAKDNIQLRKERDYWKAKYDEGCETFEVIKE